MRLIDKDNLRKPSKGIFIYQDEFEDDVQHVAFEAYTKDDIEREPTVDAEPVRHGKFVGTEYDGYADGYPVYYEWECSQCGCVFEGEEPTYKYCPNCGAKMDGERK